MKKHKPKAILKQQQDPSVKLAEMGAYLRQVRESQSMTLEEVAAKTMIRVSLLRSIEEGQLYKLPEPIYVQGFLLRFAEALGLDGVEFAKTFPIISTWRKQKIAQWYYLPMPRVRPIHLYLIYILLIMGAVKGVSGLVETSAMQESNGQQPETAETVASSEPEEPTPPTTASQTLGASQSNSNAPVRVGLIVQDSSWVQITADDKIEFEGTLQQGTERTWEAKEQLVILAGNAGGILMAVNDEQAKLMGKPGVAEEVIVRAEP
ncbi:MAG: helix-turn-helix domain-containing protein [Chroococcales cyanobacterium]